MVVFLSGWSQKSRRWKGLSLTHLLFADDTLVFWKVSQDQMFHLCWLFGVV